MAFSNYSKNAKKSSETTTDGWETFYTETFDSKTRNNALNQKSSESTTYNSVATTRNHSKTATGNNLIEFNPQTGKFKENSIIYEATSFSNEITESSEKKNPKSLQETGDFIPSDFGHEEINRNERHRGTILIEIALGANRIETLKYHDGDSVKEIALKFCLKHQLSEDTAAIIENVIQGNLEKIQRKKLQHQVSNESEERRKDDIKLPSSRESKNQKDRPAVVIELDLGDQMDSIYAFENDDPDILAAKFCEKHGIGESAMPFLIQTIQTELKRLKQLNLSNDNHSNPQEKDCSESSKTDSYHLQTIQEEAHTPTLTIQGKESETYEHWHRLINEKNATGTCITQQKVTTEKSRSPVSSQKNNTSVKSNASIFEKLYQEGVKFKKDKDQQVVEYKMEKISHENKELTFRPKITPLDPSVIKTRSQSPIFEPKRYYVEVRKAKNKEQMLEAEKTKALQEECPFKPSISETSRQIASRKKERSPSPNIHSKLFDEARDKAKKREALVNQGLKEVLKVKPEVSPRSKELVSKTKETQKERIDRLVNGAKEKQEHLCQAQKAKTALVDPQTGQQFFQPVILHDKYYHKLKEYDDARSQISLDPKTLKVKKLKTLQLGQDPENSSDPIRDTLIRRVFDTLDSDRDGLISTQNIDIKALEVNIVKLIANILYLLEDKYVDGMNYQQFLDQINKEGLSEKLVRITKKNLLKMASNDENEDDMLLEHESARNRSHNVSIRINTLETVMQAINTEKSFSRSISPRPNTSTNSETTSTVNNSVVRITKNYQKILSQKTPR